MRLKVGFVVVCLVMFVFIGNAFAVASVDDAITWAKAQERSTINNPPASCGYASHSWYLWCLRFVGRAYGNCKGGFYSAKTAWLDNGGTFGDRKTDNDFDKIPEGALVFFDTGNDGHVGLCIGDGKMIHTGITSTVVRDNISNISNYLGWRWPNAWTNDEPNDSNGDLPDLDVSYVVGRFSGESNWRKDLVMYEHETKTIQIKVKVSNDGEAEADKDYFKVKYYFSTGRSFDHNSDVKIGSDTVNYDLGEEGKSDDSDTEEMEISSSDSLISAIKTPGTYYFFVWIDSDLEEQHKSNNTSDDDSGSDEYVKITILPTPPAPASNFSASPVTGKVPLTVSFTDQSTSGPTVWSWNFGDGATSLNKNPTHTYSSTGTFTVSLTVANAYGSNTSTKSGYITVTDDTACGVDPVQIAGSSYTTVQAAYDGAATGSTIQIQDQLFSEDLLFDRDITAILKGGYNCQYNAKTGYSTVNGSVTIKGGSVTVEGLIIK